MNKIKLTVVKGTGTYANREEYVYPYSEYESVCRYIKRVLIGGNFAQVIIEREDKKHATNQQ